MTLYKRGKKYYMDLRIAGERVNKSTGKTTRREAEKVLEIERKRLLKSKDLPTTNMTLSQAADRIWEEKWSRNKSGEHTYSRIQFIFEKYDDPPVAEIDRAWITDLRQYLYRTGRKVTTVNRFLAHLRTILLMARDEWEILEKVPKVKLEAEKNNRTRIISQDEQERLTTWLRASNIREYDKDAADLVDFLCDTGLRLSEALNLKEQNFTTEGLIKLYPSDTKTSSARTVPMTPKVVEIVRKRGKNPFTNIDTYQANRSMRMGKKAIGIDDPEFCLHACRHSFASRLLESGASLYDVKELLGHTSFTTTQRYTHLAVGHLQRAVANL